MSIDYHDNNCNCPTCQTHYDHVLKNYKHCGCWLCDSHRKAKENRAYEDENERLDEANRRLVEILGKAKTLHEEKACLNKSLLNEINIIMENLEDLEYYAEQQWKDPETGLCQIFLDY